MSENQYHRWTQGGSISGTPNYWYISGVGSNNRYEITLFPTPAGTYSLTVHYTKSPTELVTTPTATSPVIPEPWDGSIIHRAIARGWRSLGELELSEKWMKLARENDFAASESTYVGSWTPTYTKGIDGCLLDGNYKRSIYP